MKGDIFLVETKTGASRPSWGMQIDLDWLRWEPSYDQQCEGGGEDRNRTPLFFCVELELTEQ